LLTCLLYATSSAQTIKIIGRVTDIETESGISYATVYIRNTHISATTDFDGYYKLEIKTDTGYIGVSCIGYNPQLRPVKRTLGEETLNFELERVDTNVNSRIKQRLRKSEAGALDIIKKVIAHKERHSKKQVSSYAYEAYTKLQGNMIELTPRFMKRKAWRTFSFVFDHIDSTTEVRPFLPFFISETVSDFYHEDKRFSNREVIKASRISGVDDISITQFLGGNLQADIYNDYILLATRQFISPVSTFGPDCYIYYLEDSQVIDHYKCCKIRFTPRSLKLSQLEGEIWVTDQSYAVKTIRMKMENNSGINPIRSVFLYNEFIQVNNSVWMLKKEVLGVNTIRIKRNPSLALRRSTVFSHYVINEKPEMMDSVFQRSLPDVSISDSAGDKTKNYWQRVRRNAGMLTHEERIYDMVDTLAKLKMTHRYLNYIQLATIGYADVGPLSIGSVFSFITRNPIDGLRLKYGMRTNYKFSKQVRLGAYAAFGTKSLKVHYGGEVLWLIKRNPRLSILASFRSDLTPTRTYNTFYPTTELLTTYGLRRREDGAFIKIKLMAMREFKVGFNHEFKFGYSYAVSFLNQQLQPLSYFNFDYHTAADNSSPNTDITRVTITEVSLTQRLAWHERFLNSNFMHASLGSKFPVVTFQVAAGFKNVLGSQFSYYRLAATVNDTRLLGLAGRLRYNIEAGRIYGTMPYLFLQVPAASETYISAWSQFNTMTKFQFAADRYVKLVLEHHLDGLLFDRIPGLKKLKFREVYGMHMWWGDMTAANRSANYANLAANALDSGMVKVQIADRKPYVEMNAGIENILSFFRLDAVWRMTYLDPRGTRFSFRYGNCGVRLSFKYQF